jgi:hypothetical protein
MHGINLLHLTLNTSRSRVQNIPTAHNLPSSSNTLNTKEKCIISPSSGISQIRWPESGGTFGGDA